jgi:hypothetical protein
MLRRSDQLMPAVGTALNLALCSEKVGRTASAVLAYREAVELAERMGSEEKKRLQYARERVAALEPKLVRLRIAVAPDNPADIEVKRDSVPIERGQWNSAVPVDPEDHVIEASAPGRVPWQTTITASTETGFVLVTVPSLVAVPTPPPVAQAVAAPPPVAQPPRTGRIIGEIGLLVLGVGTLTAGGVLGLAAKSQFNDGQSLCTSTGCPAQTRSMEQAAVTRGNVATVMASVGAAALIGAGVLWLTTPSSSPQSGAARPRLRVGLGPLGVGGVGIAAGGAL